MDTILYTESSGSNGAVKGIKANGTGGSTLATYPIDTVKAASPNPMVANQFAFASVDTTGPTAKLYRGNATLSTTGALQLSPTTFEDIDDVQFTPDGQNVIFKAVTPGSTTGYKIYIVPVTGGPETLLDQVFEFSVCPIQGSNLIVYSKDLGTTSEVHTINYVTGTKAKLTNLGGDVFYPTWSRDATKILFISSVGGGNRDVYQVPSNGGATTQITNTVGVSEDYAFFNSDASKIAFLSSPGTGTNYNLGVMNANGSSPTTIVSSDTLGLMIYWTSTLGRSPTVNIPGIRFGKSRRDR